MYLEAESILEPLSDLVPVNLSPAFRPEHVEQRLIKGQKQPKEVMPEVVNYINPFRFCGQYMVHCRRDKVRQGPVSRISKQLLSSFRGFLCQLFSQLLSLFSWVVTKQMCVKKIKLLVEEIIIKTIGTGFCVRGCLNEPSRHV